MVREGPSPSSEAGPERGFFLRLKKGLIRTRENLVTRIDRLLGGEKELSEDLLEEMEEILITSDLGVKTTYHLLDHLRKEVSRDQLDAGPALREALKQEILRLLQTQEQHLEVDGARPFIIMVVGVNGVGKTTTIAKLAYRFRQEGRKVLLAAADTFRAAGIEQLEIWGQRAGCEVIKQKSGSDPGAVAFDAFKAALARQVQVVIIDTAGRLHTQVNLMEELKKIKRVLAREMPGAPHEVLLVLDATTGQNAISQSQLFAQAVGVSGLALTKLDGTAKGGIIVAISQELKIPLRYIGVGEKMEDLRDFWAQEFVEALFERDIGLTS